MNIMKKQKGTSLVELMLYIAIAALIVIGSIVIYNKVNESNKAQELSKGFGLINSTLHHIYGTQPNYGVVAADLGVTLASSGALPSNMVSGGAVVSSYGALSVLVGANARQFTTTYASGTIPSGVCSKFIPNLLNSVRSITIGGALITTPASAIIECAKPGANGNDTSPDIIITSD